MLLDTLEARERQVALLERYDSLLTDHQRRIADLYLRRDLSLSEIAQREGVTRAAVHDLVRRSVLQLEGYERRLGLLAEAARRRRGREALTVELGELQRRLSRLESRLGSI